MKISVILGTRPEAIKLAPVILGLRRQDAFGCHVCTTAQHREMLDQTLKIFGIVPDTDLDLMRPNQNLSEVAAHCLIGLDSYLKAQRPDLMLVQGDTTTVLAAALAGFYNGIPVGHVEAGLRTGDLNSPWPEEANRVLTTNLAALHFAPTEACRHNLLDEGVLSERILVTGNTVIDALFLALDRVRKSPPSVPGLDPSVYASKEPLVLITGHRRENFGEKLRGICAAILELAALFPHVHFVYPVHMNPNVRSIVLAMLEPGNGDRTRGSGKKNIHLLEPLTYIQFVAMMARSRMILTDSGGVQEEAPSLGKPVLVTRDTTERPEAIAAGTAKLVGTDPREIVIEVGRLLTDAKYYRSMSTKQNPYGDGKATERILSGIEAWTGCNALSKVGPANALRHSPPFGPPCDET